MGRLLKNAVLPVLCVLHSYVVLLIVVKDDIAGAIEMFDWPAKEDGDTSLTMWEKHSFGIIGGGHLAFLVLNMKSIVIGNSGDRLNMAIFEFMWWAWGGYDAWRKGFPCAFANVIATACAIAIFVHFKEPGIFTTDKNKDQMRTVCSI